METFEAVKVNPKESPDERNARMRIKLRTQLEDLSQWDDKERDEIVNSNSEDPRYLYRKGAFVSVIAIGNYMINFLKDITPQNYPAVVDEYNTFRREFAPDPRLDSNYGVLETDKDLFSEQIRTKPAQVKQAKHLINSLLDPAQRQTEHTAQLVEAK